MKEKPITIEELDKLVKEAQAYGDWSKVENANVSEITDMSIIFCNVKGIEKLDLSRWDTSNVIEMYCMFYGSDFNSPLHFDTSNVVNMSFMFAGSQFNQPLNLDFSSVIDMESMFQKSSFNQPLDIDVSEVCGIGCIFKDSSFNQDISDWVIKDNIGNKDTIEYRDKCIQKNIEKDFNAIKSVIKNKNKDKLRL